MEDVDGELEPTVWDEVLKAAAISYTGEEVYPAGAEPSKDAMIASKAVLVHVIFSSKSSSWNVVCVDFYKKIPILTQDLNPSKLGHLKSSDAVGKCMCGSDIKGVLVCATRIDMFLYLLAPIVECTRGCDKPRQHSGCVHAPLSRACSCGQMCFHAKD